MLEQVLGIENTVVSAAAGWVLSCSDSAVTVGVGILLDPCCEFVLAANGDCFANWRNDWMEPLLAKDFIGL